MTDIVTGSVFLPLCLRNHQLPFGVHRTTEKRYDADILRVVGHPFGQPYACGRSQGYLGLGQNARLERIARTCQQL